jgi:hypothetical protein
MITASIPIDNGVNAQALTDARAALTHAPAGASFQWRATCDWVHGTHSASTVEGISGLGAEHKHRTRFTFDADHPDCFAAEDPGATPVEYVLVGLASCLTAGGATIAQHRGIQLHSVRATVQGDMDIQAILGIDGDVRNGFPGFATRAPIRTAICRHPSWSSSSRATPAPRRPLYTRTRA